MGKDTNNKKSIKNTKNTNVKISKLKVKYVTDKNHIDDNFVCSKYFDRVKDTDHKRFTNTIKGMLTMSLLPFEIAIMLIRKPIHSNENKSKA